MSDDLNKVIAQLQTEGSKQAEQAFRNAASSALGIGVDLVPFGFYGRSRGKAGKNGGDLKQSLRLEIVKEGDRLIARFVSALPYARRQHDQAFYHPGLYTGAPGDKYAAQYFDRPVRMIFLGEADPLGKYTSKPTTFKEYLEDAKS